VETHISKNEQVFTLSKYRCTSLQDNPQGGYSMSFFDSEVVRSEMVEINELQEEIYKNVFQFPTMKKEEKVEHVEMLERLLEKQRVLYTRLSLSEDPEAKMMKENIVNSAKLMGMPDNMDMNIIFQNMEKMLEVMRYQIDKSSI
jgi:hypothetical protein